MSSAATLTDTAIGRTVWVVEVGGERAFRRRLMELGLVPGTAVVVRKRAPFGGPIELAARGCMLSIRRADAQQITVSALPATTAAA